MIGPRSGVGHTAACVVSELAAQGEEVVLLPVTARGAGRLRREAPAGARVPHVRLPARLASWVWSRSSWPPAELFCGAVDVFWGPNFLLPPLVKAAGVLTIHDLAFIRVPETCSEHVLTYRRTVPRMAARANRIIVPSRSVAEEVADWLPEQAERIRVVHPGIRTAFAEPGGGLTEPRRRRLGVRDPYLVYVGNLELRKNLDVLLGAFELVLAVHPGAQLVCVGGPGVGWDGIAKRHDELISSPSVVVTGYLPDGEVAALLRGARAFAYPSRYEGFGIPPLEAMAAGTPVVASKASSLPEALGGHATYVAPDDREELARALSDLLDGRPARAELEAARAWARTFTWKRAAEATREVFSEAIEEVAA